MTDVVGFTGVSGEGVSRQYKAHVQLPAWGFGLVVVGIILLIGVSLGKERFASKVGPRGSLYEGQGERFLNGGQVGGPQFNSVSQPATDMLQQGVAAGGSDSDGADAAESERFKRGRKELMAGGAAKHSEAALENIVRNGA